MWIHISVMIIQLSQLGKLWKLFQRFTSHLTCFVSSTWLVGSQRHLTSCGSDKTLRVVEFTCESLTHHESMVLSCLGTDLKTSLFRNICSCVRKIESFTPLLNYLSSLTTMWLYLLKVSVPSPSDVGGLPSPEVASLCCAMCSCSSFFVPHVQVCAFLATLNCVHYIALLMLWYFVLRVDKLLPQCVVQRRSICLKFPRHSCNISHALYPFVVLKKAQFG